MTENSHPQPDFRQPEPAQKKSRARSTIEFPYINLEDSMGLVRAVHQIGGNSCEWSQLAAKFGQSPKGGAFRQKLLAARTFGLLSYRGEDVDLTEIGRRTIDHSREKSAKVEAFLSVPLFAQMFDALRDQPLPPSAAIQRQMEQMGVAPKLTERVRQIFIRSARYSGFFELAADRLVKPNVNEKSSGEDTDKTHGGVRGGGEPPKGPRLHPAFEGLLTELPKSKTEWPLERRAKWLQTVANVFDFIYQDEEGGSGDIKVKVVRQIEPGRETEKGMAHQDTSPRP